MAKVPDKIGKYPISSQIAKGGMGAVYKGKHPTLDRSVILKKLTLRGSSDFKERFRREARIMMDFKNDYIVDVYDHFKEGSSYYIVLEYVEGTSLEELLKKERYLPDDIALLILRDTCRALLYAHSKGVIHRDIKPGNILISKKGEVKLADFGIAISKEDQASGLTREGMTLGTPSYMAPEQFRNAKNVDRRADIYSLGVMLYEMVTGKKPYPSKLSPEALALIQKGKYRNPEKINPRIKSFTTRIIKRCMQVKPKKRYQDLRSLVKYLDNKLKEDNQENVQNRIRNYIEESAVPRKKRWSKKNKGALVSTIVFILLATGTAVYYLYSINYFHVLFFPEQYGSLRVMVRSTQGDPIEGELVNTADSNDVSLLNFTASESIGVNKNTVYRTRTQYLKTGEYSIRISSDFGLYRRTFFLEPKTIQRSDPITRRFDSIVLNIGSVPPVPLETNLRVIDRATGHDISLVSNIFLKENGRWARFNPSFPLELFSGRTYQFRITAPHYYPEVMELHTRVTQRTADVTASLIPHPGKIFVTSNHEGIKLLINGSRHYIKGGFDMSVREIEKITTEDDLELLLNPGRIRFSALYKGERVEKLIELNSSETARISVNYHDENDTLSIISLPSF